MAERKTSASLRNRVRQRLRMLATLVVVWVLLWGAFSWLNLVTGIVVGLLVMRMLYLPPIQSPGRFNPVPLAVFVVFFVADLVVASFQVAVQAFKPHPVSHNAIVAVELRTRSDLILTLTTISMSLTPGSYVVEADRFGSILYVHALGTSDDDAVERIRQKVARIERRLTDAFGSRADLERATS